MATEAAEQVLDTVHLEKLKKDLEFIQRLFTSADSVQTLVDVARAACKVAEQAAQGPAGSAKELFTLTLRGFDKDCSWHKVKDVLSEQGIVATRVDKQRGWDIAIVQVNSEQTRQQVLKLSGTAVGGLQLEVQDGRPPAEQMEQMKRGLKRTGESTRGRPGRRGRR